MSPAQPKPLKRYVAFLRGIAPAGVEDAFAHAGFSRIQVVRRSRNILFSVPRAPESELEERAEAAMWKVHGRAPLAIVRPVQHLRELLAADPYASFDLEPRAKRLVTFLRGRRKLHLALPIELQDAAILRMNGKEVFSAYRPSIRGPVFIGIIEQTLGNDVTTRTWETLAKVVAA